MKKAFFAAAVLALALTGTATAAQTVRLGLVGGIYEDFWAPAKEELAKEGIDLEFVPFTDYVTPNRALSDGDIELNAFQHDIYLQNEIKEYGYKLTAVGSTFIIPLNLYSRKVKSVADLKDGDVIAIPNDPTNGGRALKVLAAAGIVRLKDGASFSPTKEDIEEYKVKVEISEMAANTIPSVLPDVAAAIINCGYAMDFGLTAEDIVFNDTSVSDREYWNIIVARTADLEDPAKVELFRRIVKAFQSPATKAVFDGRFGGQFLPAGWGEDLLKRP